MNIKNTLADYLRKATSRHTTKTILLTAIALMSLSYDWAAGNFAKLFYFIHLEKSNGTYKGVMGKLKKRHNGMTQTREPPFLRFDSS